ncbi:uncharacterized protein TNCV_15991 [Trichonephila clavipes]|nr:uncharacterized protein TNCV_15991 [Trichonephila clavipes]
MPVVPGRSIRGWLILVVDGFGLAVQRCPIRDRLEKGQNEHRKQTKNKIKMLLGVFVKIIVLQKKAKEILMLQSDEAHFWLNGYVSKQNCRIWSEANPQVYVKTPLHPEKLTVWCALWAGGILLQKR